jgi:hypothetical protein
VPVSEENLFEAPTALSQCVVLVRFFRLCCTYGSFFNVRLKAAKLSGEEQAEHKEFQTAGPEIKQCFERDLTHK